MKSLKLTYEKAVTTHFPEWKYILLVMKKDRPFMGTIKSLYPRMKIHSDIASVCPPSPSLTSSLTDQLTAHIKGIANLQDQGCLLFFAPEHAAACVAFATSPLRKENMVLREEIAIRVFGLDVRLYAVFFPMERAQLGVMPYWTHAGVGISSRLAEESLKHISLLHEVVDTDSPTPAPQYELCVAHAVIKQRIAGLMNRATVQDRGVKEDDVFLFQTGMAAIYSIHTYLLSLHPSSNSNSNPAQTILFGFAFHSTPHVFEEFGPGCKHFAAGTSAELDELSTYLASETAAGRKIQAIWTEFPSNPLLTVPDMKRLRELADRYKTLLIVDDTIASFCNVDLLGVADIVVSSLSKSFNGFADLLAGSAVLSPSSAHYSVLKPLFRQKYRNYLYNLDAEQLEVNSRDYLSRSAKLNDNAAALVAYLQPLTLDPKSCIKQIHYPSSSSTSSSCELYNPYMRLSTPSFTPGYGCLMSIEFVDMASTISFFENVNVHIGPHLGAHLTLALPYVKGLYGMELERVGRSGLRESQIRVSVGLEEAGELVGTFGDAVGMGDGAMGGEEVWRG